MKERTGITLQITVPEGAGNTLWTDCGDCALHFHCPNGGWCGMFDFANATVKVMRKKKEIPNPNADNALGSWTEEDWAAVYELLYQGAMQKGAAMPAFPSYLKGHQRHHEMSRAREASLRTKEDIKYEIARLQGLLDDMESTENKQLELF